MRTIRHVIIGVLATALLGPGLAAGQPRDRDRIQLRDPSTHVTDPDQSFGQRDRDRRYLRIRDRIRADARMTWAQVRAAEPELWRYHARQGDHLQLRLLAQDTARSRCGGDCFQLGLQHVNQAMRQGATDREALQMYRDALREQIRARDRLHQKLDARQLHARVEQSFERRMDTWRAERERARQSALAQGPGDRIGDQERDRLREQERDRLREQERDRLRDQERDRLRDRTPR